MNKFLLAVVIVLIVSFSDGLKAQNNSVADQLTLMEKFVGTWQFEQGKDTLLASKIEKHGRAFVETYYKIFGDKQSWLSVWSYSYSSKERRFKLFGLDASGAYSTWIASFTEENKWIQYQVSDFDPEKIISKAEILFDSTESIKVTFFNSANEKTLEMKWFKTE